MNLNESNDNYLNILLQKISKEKKNVFLLDDFNDLRKYDKHDGTLHPTILYPTRITAHSQTIIEHIFSNYFKRISVR